jgi:AcrR family transcriptional regulator
MTISSSKYHHGNLKQALVEAGQQILIEKGINGLSLRETAKAAGVSHTAPYRHFMDKEALLAAIAESGFESLAEALLNTIEQHPDDPKEQLAAATAIYVKLAVTRLEMHQLMFGDGFDDDAMSETMLETKQQAFNALSKIIENGQKKNIFKKAETLELVIAMWSMMHGYAMLLTTGQLRDSVTSLMQIEKLARSVATHLIDGLAER